MPFFLALHAIEVPTVDCVSVSATPKYVVAPPMVHSAAVQQKCESWLRRQHTDLMSLTEPFFIESDLPPNTPAVNELAHAPEQQMSVIVNVSTVINSLDCSYYISKVQPLVPLVQHMGHPLRPRGL